MQGSFMSKHSGNSYFHKQNLLDDMPVDDHAGGPLNQTETGKKETGKNEPPKNKKVEYQQAFFEVTSPEKIKQMQEAAKKNKMKQLLNDTIKGGKHQVMTYTKK